MVDFDAGFVVARNPEADSTHYALADLVTLPSAAVVVEERQGPVRQAADRPADDG